MTTYQFPERPSSYGKKGTLNSIAITTAITVLIIGFAVIVGWMLNIPLLKSVLPGLVTMKANTALGFILGGTSLWCWRRQQETRQPSAESEDFSPPFLLYSTIAAFGTLYQVTLNCEQ
jgi:methyl-accepting chemotaxis protein